MQLRHSWTIAIASSAAASRSSGCDRAVRRGASAVARRWASQLSVSAKSPSIVSGVCRVDPARLPQPFSSHFRFDARSPIRNGYKKNADVFLF
jgi:hypothetical protein